MPFYRRTCKIEIIPYTPGLEDAVDENGRPYIMTLTGPIYLFDGSYICKDVSGSVWVISKKVLESNYKLVED